MASIMTKRGSLDNIVTYEHICDTKQDLDNIESAYVTLGSTAIVLNEDNGPGVYMADSNKEWNSLTGGSENMNDNISVDATLTQSEAAADAKVTGDKIAEINTTINELKNVIQNNTFVDPVTNFDNIQVIGERIVSPRGRYLNTSSPSHGGAALDSSEGYLYVYKGSTITANHGYKFSYAIWENPPISGSLEGNPIIMQLDVSKQTITIEQDGYLVLSASTMSGYYPASMINPQMFMESAITIKLYLENTKEKLSSITARLNALEETIQGLQEQINNLT